jgi:hypothetical protein
VDPGITVHNDLVGELADELAALAAELDDDARTCRSTAVRLADALGGDEGWHAEALATAWAGLATVVAARAGAVAATLVSATVAYRGADAALARGIADPRPGRPR